MTKETKKKISESLKKIPEKTCLKCGTKLNRKNNSFLCKNCKPKKIKKSKIVISWIKRRKEILVEYKGGKCEICGYNKCLAALDFHHKNPKEKEFNISKKGTNGIENSKKEVDKCLLVCSNCHREIHFLNNLNS